MNVLASYVSDGAPPWLITGALAAAAVRVAWRDAGRLAARPHHPTAFAVTDPQTEESTP